MGAEFPCLFCLSKHHEAIFIKKETFAAQKGIQSNEIWLLKLNANNSVSQDHYSKTHI
jgi:hypothetical protein